VIALAALVLQSCDLLSVFNAVMCYILLPAVTDAADVVDAECDCCFDMGVVAKTINMTAGYLSYCHSITVDWRTFFQRAQWLLDQVCLL
jgi:hypothetical protein